MHKRPSRSGGAGSGTAAAVAVAPAPARNPSRALMPALAIALVVAVAVAVSQWAALSQMLGGTSLSGLAGHQHASSSGGSAGVTAPSPSLPSPPHWGTYRPNLYLGVRGLWGSSPLFGWAWSCAGPAPAATSTGAAASGHLCSAADQIQSLRHDAEERDGVSKYGWLKHNGDNFGVQGIVDRKMGVNFTTSFIQPEGAKDRWAVRIEARPVGLTPRDDLAAQAAPRTISLFFYMALTDAEHRLQLLSDHERQEQQQQQRRQRPDQGEQVVQRLYAGPEAGELIVRSGIVSSSSSGGSTTPGAGGGGGAVRTYLHGLRVDESVPPPARPGHPAPPPRKFTWAAKDLLQQTLSESYRPSWTKFSQKVQRMQREHQQQAQGGSQQRPFIPPPAPHFVPVLPNSFDPRSNFFVVQHVVQLPFVADFVLQPKEVDEAMHGDGEEEEDASADTTADAAADAPVVAAAAVELGRTDRWFTPGGQSLSQALSSRSREFDARFAKMFPQSAGSDSETLISTPQEQDQKEFSQALLSNLLGGIGFFHGRQLIETRPERREIGRDGREIVTPATIVEESEDQSLLTAVPSRSFFPRGFMWDEGFHQLLVSRWDLRLSLSILESWFGKVDLSSAPVGGWLAREQIRGEESRRRVPSEFRAQKPRVANPPTLILALERILERLTERPDAAATDSLELQAQRREELEMFTAFLVRWLPVLHVHVSWFFRTQASLGTPTPPEQIGQIDLATGEVVRAASSSSQSSSSSAAAAAAPLLPLSFRWAGRTKDHCLASGLDDYPRAKWIPSLAADKSPEALSSFAQTKRGQAQAARDRAASEEGGGEATEALLAGVGAEGHVDLHAWMIMLSNTMAGLMEYAHTHVTNSSNSSGTHDASPSPSSSSSSSLPSSVNYASVARSYRSYARNLTQSLLSLHWDASSGSFGDFAYRRGARVMQRHHGYVSLMPLMLGVLHPREHRGQLLRVLQSLQDDKWSLRSPGGIRSLSKDDALFGSKEDYWRGHVWVNMQYLFVSSLQRLARDERAGNGDEADRVRSLAASLALDVRRTVSANVFAEYQRTGFVWEQYHAIDARGRKSHPFTGWTALTLLLMTEP